LATSLSRARAEERRGEDWWTITLDADLWWFVDRLDASDVQALRAESLIRARRCALETNVIYTTTRK
jgi:hypothetical protein